MSGYLFHGASLAAYEAQGHVGMSDVALVSRSKFDDDGDAAVGTPRIGAQVGANGA